MPALRPNIKAVTFNFVVGGCTTRARWVSCLSLETTARAQALIGLLRCVKLVSTHPFQMFAHNGSIIQGNP